MPYGRAKNPEVVERVQRGQILSRPAQCPHQVYEVGTNATNFKIFFFLGGGEAESCGVRFYSVGVVTCVVSRFEWIIFFVQVEKLEKNHVELIRVTGISLHMQRPLISQAHVSLLKETKFFFH
jgi:hypothetical protein